MPKSKVRKKTTYTPPAGGSSGVSYGGSKGPKPSPAWYAPVLGGFLVVGLAYIVTYYVASERVPVMRDMGAWNFAVGFGFLFVGLSMAVRWR